MARRPINPPPAPPFTLDELKRGRRWLQEALAELKSFDVSAANPDDRTELQRLATKISSAVDRAFPAGSPDHDRYSRASSIHGFHSIRIGGFGQPNPTQELREYQSGLTEDKATSTGLLTSALEVIEGDIRDLGGSDDDPDPSKQVLRAYEGLSLHTEISRAASKLYRDGHYANAVEASVKALNGLVRMRSELEFDGSTLMERAFGSKTPVLRFNALADASDKDEQRGFMMLFSGAVAGLRNPRAHGFIEDDPERALEFIAFVSLLAKLLDKADRE